LNTTSISTQQLAFTEKAPGVDIPFPPITPFLGHCIQNEKNPPVYFISQPFLPLLLLVAFPFATECPEKRL